MEMSVQFPVGLIITYTIAASLLRRAYFEITDRIFISVFDR